MKFALFYEIPVPRPWERGQRAGRLPEHARAGHRRRPLRLARLLDRRAPLPAGVLALLEPRGARTAPSRRGPSGSGSVTASGSCPSPTTTRCARRSRWPCSTCCRTGGSTWAPVDRPPGPSSRASGSIPAESRQMWQEAIGHVVGCWTNDEYEFDGEYWQMPKRRVQPKPWQKPHPPLWGATTSDEGHAQVGDLGLGLCSFAVGLPPVGGQAQDRRLPRAPSGGAPSRSGPSCNNQAATFTMAICASRPGRGRWPRPGSPSSGTRRPAPARSPR